MQLDRARIAIRQRSWLDNLDLALHVLRNGGAPLAASALVGIVPFALVNYQLLKETNAMGPERLATWIWAAMLVAIEAPLATACLTLYLGQFLFSERPDAGRMARELASSLPQLLLLQGLLRGTLIFLMVTAFLPYVAWPYLGEVILLERNPLRARGGQPSTMSRSSSLHRGGAAEALVRLIAGFGFAVALASALEVSLRYVFNDILGYELGWRGQVVMMQVVLWLVMTYFAVARFLNYLDQRIRHEGWEVELLLRAQRNRLTRSAA